MIIWIASYPKSGNTWVRAFINKFFLKEKFDLNFLGNVVPQFPKKTQYEGLIDNYQDLDLILNNSIQSQKRLIEHKKIKFLKTHSIFYKLQNGRLFSDKTCTLGAIYLVRDPRNVFLSLQNHSDWDQKEMEKIFFSETRWVGQKFDNKDNKDYALKTLIGNWQINLNSWRSAVRNLLILKYEDLIENPFLEFSKIIKYLNKFINLEVKDNELKKIIQEINFDNLKNIENEKGFIESMTDKNNNKINFFSKGPKRNWVEEISPEINKKIENKFFKEMREFGYIQ